MFPVIQFGLAQNRVSDSLIKKLNEAEHDTIKLKTLVQLSNICESGEIIKYCKPAIELADRLLHSEDKPELRVKILKRKAQALANLGYYYNSKGDFHEALNYINQSLKIQEEIGDKNSMSSSYNNLGFMYSNQGNIPTALEYYGKSLKLNLETGNKTGAASALSNTGMIYLGQGDTKAALSYLNRSLKLFEELKAKKNIAGIFNNLGLLYNKQKNNTKSFEYFNKSLKIQEEINDQQGIANSINNIASIYRYNGELDKAQDYYKRSLKIQKQIDDKIGLSNTFNNIASAYFKQEKLDLADAYCDSANVLAKKIGLPEMIRNSERLFFRIDSAKGNFKQAFEHYKLYITYRDQVNNEQNRRASIKSQLKNDFDKKEAVIREQQEKERLLTKEKERFHLIIIVSVVIGLILVIGFAIFILRSLQLTRKQKLIIEAKQKEILDSIHYAKRIQLSLLPTDSYIHNSISRLKKYQ